MNASRVEALRRTIGVRLSQRCSAHRPAVWSAGSSQSIAELTQHQCRHNIVQCTTRNSSCVKQHFLLSWKTITERVHEAAASWVNQCPQHGGRRWGSTGGVIVIEDVSLPIGFGLHRVVRDARSAEVHRPLRNISWICLRATRTADEGVYTRTGGVDWGGGPLVGPSLPPSLPPPRGSAAPAPPHCSCKFLQKED